MKTRHMQQQGSALIVSLLILIVMTLIGLTGIASSTLEEKMAGNTRDQALAFQAAEAALRDGEAYYQNSINTDSEFDNADGRYKEPNHDPFSDATWDNSRDYSGTIASVSEQPRYIIELIGPIEKPLDPSEPLSETPIAVRVTARATGGTTNARVLLQSYYAKKLN